MSHILFVFYFGTETKEKKIKALKRCTRGARLIFFNSVLKFPKQLYFFLKKKNKKQPKQQQSPQTKQNDVQVLYTDVWIAMTMTSYVPSKTKCSSFQMSLRSTTAKPVAACMINAPSNVQ